MVKQLHLKYDIEELTGRTQVNDAYYNSWNEIESRNVENRLCDGHESKTKYESISYYIL